MMIMNEALDAYLQPFAEQGNVLDAQKLFATKHRSISKGVIPSHDASNCGLDEGKCSQCR
jgi:hypothetical protein